MAYVDDLIIIRDNLVEAIKTATANPKPNYVVDGRSFSWSDYLKNLREQLAAINDQINQQQPYVINTVNYM